MRRLNAVWWMQWIQPQRMRVASWGSGDHIGALSEAGFVGVEAARRMQRSYGRGRGHQLPICSASLRVLTIGELIVSTVRTTFGCWRGGLRRPDRTLMRTGYGERSLAWFRPATSSSMTQRSTITRNRTYRLLQAGSMRHRCRFRRVFGHPAPTQELAG